MRRLPAVTGETAAIIRMVDDLPAPFGPRKPNDSPRATAKSTASTAVKPPNDLVSACAWIIGSALAVTRSRLQAVSDSRRPIVLFRGFRSCARNAGSALLSDTL